ncbi:hypothetical protein [Pseudonocardia sp. NPDC046786]|uniref:hypothetical protein n=1 Tax=Pseudonocardia sp. NPDC046786 TaxID=3155471 RepID=UPI0033E5A929
MPIGRFGTARRLLTEAVAALESAADPAADAGDLLSVLTLCGEATRRPDRAAVATIAPLDRRGAFAERRYRSPEPDDAALFDALATAVDALAAPRDALDERRPEERRAEALAEICGHALDRGAVPDTGGRRSSAC